MKYQFCGLLSRGVIDEKIRFLLEAMMDENDWNFVGGCNR